MNKALKKIFLTLIAAALLFACVPAVYSSTPQSHVAIAVSPGELAQPGPVTITILLRNTESASATNPPASTYDPGHTPVPTSGPGDRTGRDGSYTDITIANPYGVTFNTSGVTLSAGSQMTFTGTLNATDDLIGVPLTFTVSWTVGGVRTSENVSCTIIRRNVSPVLSVTRTAYPVNAAPGAEVTFKYTFTNTGSVTLVNISLSDRYVYGRSASMYTIDSLAPGESDEFTYVMIMGSSTVVSSPVVTFYSQGGSTQLTYSVSSLTIGVIQSQLAKEVVVGEPTPEGVMFTLYLTNNGNQRLNNLKVTDELGENVSSAAFSLAVGESKVIEYFVHDPEEVRYVVFYIRGTDSTGTEFRDNTRSFIVRPYIDKSLEGLSFSAVTTSSMNEEHMIGIEFSVANTGSLELYNVTVKEQRLDYELYKWATLEVGASDRQMLDVNIGELRDLVFVLTAEDSSGNVYTYEAHVSAEDIDVQALVPTGDPKNNQGGVGVVDDDTGLGKKLDGLMTDVGKKLQSWFRVLGMIAAAAAVAMLGLAITELVLRRNSRANAKKSDKA